METVLLIVAKLGGAPPPRSPVASCQYDVSTISRGDVGAVGCADRLRKMVWRSGTATTGPQPRTSPQEIVDTSYCNDATSTVRVGTLPNFATMKSTNIF